MRLTCMTSTGAWIFGSRRRLWYTSSQLGHQPQPGFTTRMPSARAHLSSACGACPGAIAPAELSPRTCCQVSQQSCAMARQAPLSQRTGAKAWQAAT